MRIMADLCCLKAIFNWVVPLLARQTGQKENSMCFFAAL